MEGGDVDPNDNGAGSEFHARAAVHARSNRRFLERVTIPFRGGIGAMLCS